MKRRQKPDALATVIERALDLGRFVPYQESLGYVDNLERAKDQIDALLEEGGAEQAVRLYEMFLAGCHEKAEEIDDSGGYLGDFFENMFISWITARQKAKCAAADTVRQILNWMDHDDYGFCWNIEEEVARALNKEGLQLFKEHFHNQLETALAEFQGARPNCIHDYPHSMRRPVGVLKAVYIAKKDISSYLALCELISTSPKDCERVAELYRKKRRFSDALDWVERGLSLEKKREWGNEASHSLAFTRQELLSKVGRRQEALQSAWELFKKYPSEYGYADLMKLVPKDQRKEWHGKAMEVARRLSLGGFIDICVKTKEWDALAGHVSATEREHLEDISHYSTEKAAKGLERRFPLAAAKVYAALGMRIVNNGKSKYYQYALGHLRKANILAQKAGDDEMWLSLIEEVRQNHKRKRGFMEGFEEIVAGRSETTEDSFAERTRKRWNMQI